MRTELSLVDDHIAARSVDRWMQVGEVAQHSPTIDASTPVRLVDEAFRRNRDLRALLVRDRGAITLLTRHHADSELAGTYGYGRALYARKTARDLLPPAGLVLPAETPLAQAARAILDRGSERRYDDVVVTWQDGQTGILSPADVFEQLATLFHHAATHDVLTGLPNRALLAELGRSLVLAADGERRAAVLYVDLDGFKDVNDSLGHRAGDDVLIGFAQRLNSCLRAGDVAGRLGGDEFAVLLASVTDVEAMAIAERLVLLASAPFVIDDRAISLSASVGVAFAGEVGTETLLSPLDVLLGRADVAMLQAKRSGKSQVRRVQESDELRTGPSRGDILQRLRPALDAGLITAHFQPKVSLPAREVVELEALARWYDPDIGLVSPVDFIPVAESTGLILQLGRQILRQACLTARSWLDAGQPWSVAVNLSPVQIAAPGLLEDVRTALAEAGLPADRLRLEITETTAIADIASCARTLALLAELGVQLSLDDFGTGHSSLSVLRQLPVHELKIDKTFVDNLHLDPTDAALTELVVRTAHTLGLTVTAEGVEHQEQLDRLIELGCDFAQGFLLGRPAPDVPRPRRSA